MTDLPSDDLLEEVQRALKAEGCFAEIEIVRLLGAAQLEDSNHRSNTSPDVRRCLLDVQTRLGGKFQPRSPQRKK